MTPFMNNNNPCYAQSTHASDPISKRINMDYLFALSPTTAVK